MWTVNPSSGLLDPDSTQICEAKFFNLQVEKLRSERGTWKIADWGPGLWRQTACVADPSGSCPSLSSVQ